MRGYAYVYLLGTENILYICVPCEFQKAPKVFQNGYFEY